MILLPHHNFSCQEIKHKVHLLFNISYCTNSTDILHDKFPDMNHLKALDLFLLLLLMLHDALDNRTVRVPTDSLYWMWIVLRQEI